MKCTIAIPKFKDDLLRIYMQSKYTASLRRAGAEALWIEPDNLEQAIDAMLRCDGLLLSGGESFKASLALALGLSDEVQMSTGIRLDTLFVDEGFGSLDPESLEQAYRTLAGLTEGNRLVGIISHVSELKEKIDRQILVTKAKSGGSHARMVV